MSEQILTCTHDNCMRTYTNEENLKRHIEAIHRGSQQYECQYCHKHLSSKQNLREHTYIHTGERPYICREPGCGASFRQGSQLSAHKRIHGAIRRYSSKTNFTELKVMISQLTTLLERDPRLLNECIQSCKIEPSDESAELPGVRGSTCYAPLPWFGDHLKTEDPENI